jgi:hypothetical protein
MNLLFIWLLPPLVGAVIGYVTNAIAIKMLFRPLKEVRFFGIRIPFTPGILPRRRHKLAAGIGAMVEGELITPEIIKQRLRREDVRENIKTAVAGYTEKIFACPLSRLVPGDKRDGDSAAVQAMALLFQGLIESPAFISLFDKALEGFLFSRSIREILGDAETAELRKKIEGIIAAKLSAEGDRIVLYLAPVLEQSFPRLALLFIQFLEREEIRRELEIHGRVFLSSAILKLNVFQRFFISAAQYDRTLHERMPEIIDDLILQLDAMLRDESVRDRLIVFIGHTVKNILSGKKTGDGFPRFVTDLLFAGLDRPLGEIIREASPGTDGESLSRKMLKLIQGGFIPGDRTERGRGSFLLFLEALSKEGKDYRIADLFLIDGEKKEIFDSLICDRLIALAEEQTDGALRSIDIKEMVTERIDSLEMIRVEGIVLDVIGRELKWINIFGAILGALIGLFQGGLSWFIQAF